MATFYIDPILGNDANAGTSTGTAWKTLVNGPLAGRVAPGDLIKVKKSPEYTVSGTTWTNGSADVTLPANTTLSIEQGVGNTWTSAANVTGGTSTARKLGANGQQFTLAAGFTTGKIGHKATGTLDLSGYTMISFWIRSSIAISTGTVLSLTLCSDTTGDTPVVTIPIGPLAAGTIYPVTYYHGSALPSSIQSVALTAASDPGIPVLAIQNIFATNGISLTTTIGPSADTAFHPIGSIVNNSLLLDSNDTTVSGTGGWIGTTGTYTTTCIDSYQVDRLAGNLTEAFQLNESGTSALAATLSGGWDFGTDTRTGYTSYNRIANGGAAYYNVVYENFILARPKGIIGPGTTAYVTYKNIIFSGSTNAPCLSFNDTGRTTDVQDLQFYHCTSPITFTNSGTTRIFRNCKFVLSTIGVFGTTLASAVQCYNCTFTSVVLLANNPTFNVVFSNCLINGSTTFPAFSSNNNQSQFSLINCTGAAMPITATRLVLGHQFRAYWQTTTKQGSDPGAWRLDSFGTSREIGTPNLFKIGEILCSTPSTPVTVTAWIKKDNSTGIGISLGVMSYELAGVSETFTTKANNTSWEQVSVTFTPTEAGIISIYARAWHAGTSTQVFIGSLTIT